jgi:hypothetical protein
VDRFVLPKLDDVFVSLDDGTESGDRGSPGNEDGHYSGRIQPQDLIEEQDLNFAEGNIVKLVCRYRRKGGLIDLGKIVYYIYRLISQWIANHPEDRKLIHF